MGNTAYSDEELEIYNGLAGFAYSVNFTTLEPEITLEKMTRLDDVNDYTDIQKDIDGYTAQHPDRSVSAHILPSPCGRSYRTMVYLGRGTACGSTIGNLEVIEKGERDVDPGMTGDDFWHRVPVKGLPPHVALYVDIPNKADMEFNDLTRADTKDEKWRMYLVDANQAEVWTKEIDCTRKTATEIVKGLLPVFERGMSVADGLQLYVDLRAKIMPPRAV